MIAPGLQDRTIWTPVVHLLGTRSARVQDFYAVSVQARVMRSRPRDKFDTGDGLVRLPRRAPAIFMQILKRIGLILIWLAGAVFIFAAVNKNDPYLISLRGRETSFWPQRSIIAVVVLIRRGYWRRGDRRKVAHSAVVPAIAVDARRACFVRVAQAERLCRPMLAQARSLGRHFIVGYSSFPEVAALAEKGLISGVYITRHNIVGSTAERLKDRDLGAAGQAARRRPATPDRRRRPGRRHRIASGAALDQAAGAIDACEPGAGCSRREGGGVRAYARAGTGGARRQPEPGAGAGSATPNAEAQPA